VVTLLVKIYLKFLLTPFLSRSLTVILAFVGIILSWMASQTCEFISYLDEDGTPPDSAEDPPFNLAVAADVGIFHYEITQHEAGTTGLGGCIPYELRFASQQDYPSLATAQICAVIGPCFAAFGAIFTLMDFCVFNFPGSFTVASLFLLVGSGVQAGVFTLIADPVFW
jgi:hypothetical protein